MKIKYHCSECGQETQFHNLCNDCVNKFMEELDKDIGRQSVNTFVSRILNLVSQVRKVKQKFKGDVRI